MDTQLLLDALQQADRKTDESWLNSLSQRKLEELEFHDTYRDASNPASLSAEERDEQYGNEKYYLTAKASKEYVERWIREHSPGRVVLDYACGAGDYTVLAAEAGAKLAVGLDISRTSVENCRRRAREAGLAENTFFVQGDCENTELPDGSVDTVICSGMLHHLDLSYAFPELRRIMRPGGKLIAMEALDYNPIIKLYRKLTPKMRTQWETEHILSLDDVKFARRFFDLEEVRYWHLFSIMTTPLRNTALFGAALKMADALDSVLLRIPPISLMAWTFTFVLVRRADS
jgi:SAM-dependent methyltransferase